MRKSERERRDVVDAEVGDTSKKARVREATNVERDELVPIGKRFRLARAVAVASGGCARASEGSR